MVLGGGVRIRWFRMKKSKVRKGVWRDFNISFVGGFCVVLCMILLVPGFVFFLGESSFRVTSPLFEDDFFVDVVVDLCDDRSGFGVVYCVNDIFNSIYEYDVGGRLSFGVLSPSELVSVKGLCRDAAVFYCSVFNRFGFECDFKIIGEFPDLHVFNIVSLSEGYCVVDQGFVECFSLGGGV